MKCLIISGRSGSGKSTVLHALEDSGFSSIDNFPASLLVRHITNKVVNAQTENQGLALCIDVRNTVQDLANLPGHLNELDALGHRPRLIYLDASDSVLVKRFSDTRRRHPLDNDFPVLMDAIAHEKKVLATISELADLRIDTTHRSLHELDEYAKERLAGHSNYGISLLFRSFGYKYGVPVDSDIVFDARCLPNPYWREDLRHLNGLHDDIKAFFDESSDVRSFFDDICAYLDRWLPIFAEQHRVYFNVAIGCTGGTHRSVYVVERLANHFRAQYSDLVVRHRDGIE